MVELDEDLGDFTVEDRARARSGRGQIIEPDGNAIGLTIETTAIGPAFAQRWVNCAGPVSMTTPVEVALRTDDGRIDIVVPGELSAERDEPMLLEVPDVALAELEGVLGVPVPSTGASDEVTGIGLDLVGIDGQGSIWWTAVDPVRTLPLADLELPYAVSELDFGP